MTIRCACACVGCGDASAPKPGSGREVALAFGDCVAPASSAALAKFAGQTAIEIAGEGAVTNRCLLGAIERASESGLADWTLVAPETLTTNPTL